MKRYAWVVVVLAALVDTTYPTFASAQLLPEPAIAAGEHGQLVHFHHQGAAPLKLNPAPPPQVALGSVQGPGDPCPPRKLVHIA